MKYLFILLALLIAYFLFFIILSRFKKQKVNIFPAVLYLLGTSVLVFVLIQLNLHCSSKKCDCELLKALCPIICVLVQSIVIWFAWKVFKKYSPKIENEFGKWLYYVINVLVIIFLIYNLIQIKDATIELWVYCLCYPVTSILSEFLSPDRVFGCENKTSNIKPQA